MCGIFGFQTNLDNVLKAKNVTKTLLNISQERGKEASGISIKTRNVNQVFKKPIKGEDLSKLRHFDYLFKNLKCDNNYKDSLLTLIGQCRLTTNGKAYIDNFNQPVFENKISLVHNGIILNTDDLIKKFVNKTSSININLEDSDSFLFCKLIDYLFSIDNNHFNNFTKLLQRSKVHTLLLFMTVIVKIFT